MLFVLLLAFLWGGNIVAIKIGLRGIPPYASAAIRFGIALPLVAVWAAIRKTRLIPTRKEFPVLMLLGVIFTVQIALLNVGTELTLAGRSTVFLNAYPVYVPVLSHFFVSGDKLSVKKSLGTAAAFGGLIVAFASGFSGAEASPLGDSLVIASGILLAVIVVMIARIVQNTPPVRLLMVEMMVGVPGFILLSILFEAGRSWDVTVSVLASIAYQGAVVGAFCFIAWSTILKKHPPSKMSAIFFTTPLWGVLISFLVLGEPLSTSLLAGAAFVALGIFLVNIPERSPAAANGTELL